MAINSNAGEAQTNIDFEPFFLTRSDRLDICFIHLPINPSVHHHQVNSMRFLILGGVKSRILSYNSKKFCFLSFVRKGEGGI